jgi:hypothetical protein
MKALILALLTLSVFSFAKNKPADLEWKTGTLLNQDSERQCGLIDGSSYCSKTTYFEVDAGDMVFTFRRKIRTKWDKELDVTVNAPIKFAASGGKFFLQDDHGQAHEVALDKKVLKPSKLIK